MKELDPFYDEKELFLFGKTEYKLRNILEKEEIEEQLEMLADDEEEKIGKVYFRIEKEYVSDSLKYKICFDELQIYDLEGLENKTGYFKLKCKNEPNIHLKESSQFHITCQNIPLELEINITTE